MVKEEYKVFFEKKYIGRVEEI